MASAHYNLALQNYTTAGINLSSDTIKVRLQRTSAYTFNATHTTMTSIGTGVGTDPTLGSKSLVDGTFDAADAAWTAVTAGAAIDCLIIYKFVTNDAGSTPLAYIDGFSVTPNGGDITAVWQGTTPFIFKI
jgi:hypothetical protein